MPFTLCHPAAVLPLARRVRPFSALAIGSMVPDLPYFLPDWAIVYGSTHSLHGLFRYCLPAGLVVFVFHHLVLREPILELLPAADRQALRASRPRPLTMLLERPLLVLGLLLTGSATHLFWDSFTHRSGWVVVSVGALSRDLLQTPLGALRPYQLLQHGGSLLGAVALALAYRSWRADLPPPAGGEQPSMRRRGTLLALLALPGAVAAGIALGSEIRSGDPVLGRALYEMITSGMAFTGLALIVYCLLWHARAVPRAVHPAIRGTT